MESIESSAPATRATPSRSRHRSTSASPTLMSRRDSVLAAH